MRLPRILRTMSSQPRLKTVDDYLHLPVEHGVELVEGAFVMSPAPDARHQGAVVQLVSILNAQVLRRKLGRVFVAPFDVHLSRLTVVQPDVLFVSRAHLGQIDRWLHGPPDIAVEFLSPGHRAHDLKRKLRLYRRHGVPEYWIGDPEARTMTIRRLIRGRWSAPKRLGIRGTVRSRLLPGVKVALRDVFID